MKVLSIKPISQAALLISLILVGLVLIFVIWRGKTPGSHVVRVLSQQPDTLGGADWPMPDVYEPKRHIVFDDFIDKKQHPLLAPLYTKQPKMVPEKSNGLTDIAALSEALAKTAKDLSKKGQPDAYVELFGKILTKSPNSRAPPSVNYEELRKNYVVPKIKYPKLADCEALLKGDKGELRKAERVIFEFPKMPKTESYYRGELKDCEAFKKKRGYVLVPTTKEEEDYPLAFSIAMYKDMEQAERLLRAVYQPQNIYCIHIDSKSPMRLHLAMYQLTGCFHNVFIASHLDKIKWGDISVLLPAMNCMRDMVKYHRGKWKYFINLTGQEMPLRTNWELVQIAKIFNGSNDIGGSKYRLEIDRVNFRWSHWYVPEYEKSYIINTYSLKEPNPYNLTFYKGELHGLFSRRMVEYIIESKVALNYLDWCWNSGHPTEHFWNTLNYNTQLKAPGGYEGPEDIAHLYSNNQVARAKHWISANYGERACEGTAIRGICVYGIRDLPWLHERPELVANKFHLGYHYLAYDCLEERHRNRTMMKDKVPFNRTFYESLPTVKYSRKDGLL